MTLSSEEIEAALEVAIIACGVARDNSRARAKPPEYDNAATTLRSHLSRLREEARFRDAARALAAIWENPDLGREDQATSAMRRAYRALEERRDA